MSVKPYRVIDAHCDTIGELLRQGGTLRESELCVTLERLKEYEGYIQFFAAWIDDAVSEPMKEAMRIINLYHRGLSENKDVMLPILKAEDFELAFSKEKIGAMLTVENGNCLEGSLENLHRLYRLGVRALTLTWNGANLLCDGIGEGRGAGLSDFGRSVVREMNDLGMIIDVSHLSEQGFWDVLEETKAPVMASHSNCQAVCQHKRNLKDEQIQALIETGGLIGLNLYPLFLHNSGTATVSDCLRHLEHILALGGENCLGLGSDFDGFSGNMPQGISGPHTYHRLFEAMAQLGWQDEVIQKISHQNFMHFVSTVLK